MKTKNIIYKNVIQKKYLNSKNQNIFQKKYLKILRDIKNNLDILENNFHQFSKNFKFNFKIRDLKKFKKFQKVVVIGMGGSILGSEAIYFFLKEKINKEFIFVNNVNEVDLHKLKLTNNLNKILFIVISKSGNTIETISNFLTLKILKKNSKNVIIISQRNDNPLYQLSKKMGLNYIEHKSYISGRYSVFSEAGFVPAFFMGINAKRLKKDILLHFKDNNKKFLQESSIKISDLLKNKKLKNIIFFNYTPRLNKFLNWNQQLIAESLGKNGKGFFPVISEAPKDHHSLLQLYLDGPKDKFFYIFSDNLANNKRSRLSAKNLHPKLRFLKNKNLSQIKRAQRDSFVNILKKKQIPYREFKIKSFKEETIGELFSYFMLETAIVGKLSNVNPFDQPAVEQVKKETKDYLT